MAQVCMVCLRAGTSDLQAAATPLRDYGLDLAQEPGLLFASTEVRSLFRIRMSNLPRVRTEVVEIGTRARDEAAIREFKARCEIAIDDLAESSGATPMMGEQVVAQEALFYRFSTERLLPRSPGSGCCRLSPPKPRLRWRW